MSFGNWGLTRRGREGGGTGLGVGAKLSSEALTARASHRKEAAPLLFHVNYAVIG